MLKKVSLLVCLTCALAATGLAQNSNSSTNQTRPRTSTTATKKPAANIEEQRATTQEEPAKPKAAGARQSSKTKQTGPQDPGAKGVLAAFEELLNGVRNADVDAAMSSYWKSPQVVFFNYNGTVTKGWKQMYENRASSYPNLKDVKLEVSDVQVLMLGRDGAVVSCLWKQSLTLSGVPETATGRMTLAFRRVGSSWKAVHLHTSTDKPDPSRVPPSEQTQPTAPKSPTKP